MNDTAIDVFFIVVIILFIFRTAGQPAAKRIITETRTQKDRPDKDLQLVDKNLNRKKVNNITL